MLLKLMCGPPDFVILILLNREATLKYQGQRYRGGSNKDATNGYVCEVAFITNEPREGGGTTGQQFVRCQRFHESGTRFWGHVEIKNPATLAEVEPRFSQPVYKELVLGTRQVKASAK